MEFIIDNEWKEKLNSQWQEPYFKQLTEFLNTEYQNNTIKILPPKIKYSKL